MKRILLILMAVAATACEMDSDIVLDRSGRLVLTSFVYPDSSTVVSVYRTVEYSDTTDYVPSSDMLVHFCVNGTLRASGVITGGQRSIDFGNLHLHHGDSIYVVAQSADGDNSEACHASSVILEPAPITRLDTVAVGDTLMRFSVWMTDDAATADYYQLRLMKRETLPDGRRRMEPLECDFSDYLFYLANTSAVVGNEVRQAGILSDELISGANVRLTFSTRREPLKPSEAGAEVELVVMLYRHTDDYYNYMLSAIEARSYVLLPVFGVPTIHSNVVGGVGIVSGMSHSSRSIMLTK